MDYDQIPAVRATHLKILAARSPLHYRHAEIHEGDGSTDSASRTYLRAVHCAILEPEVFSASYAEYTDSATRAAKVYSLWQAAHPGVTALLPSEWARIQSIRLAVLDHPSARSILLEQGQSEVALCWTERDLACKAKIDRLVCDSAARPMEVWDLKTVGNVSPDSIHSMMRRLMWPLQLAHYRAGVEALYGVRVPCGLVCVEDKEPHDVACWEIPEDMLDEAEVERQGLLQVIQSCRRTGIYPGIAPSRCRLPPPRWAESVEVEEIEEADNA